MRKHGPLHAAEIAPSKGERRPGHKGHNPGDVQGLGQRRAVKVVRMYEALSENGWKFSFSVEAMSPRGWPYRGQGSTPEEAFLRAFRAWQGELQAFVPKIPETIKCVQQSEALDQRKRSSRPLAVAA